MFNEISAPNVHISHQTYDNSWFGGKIETKTFKWIGKAPYIWESVERKYTLSGRSSRLYGSYGSIPLDIPSASTQYHRYNADTGDREMIFFHPEVPYDDTDKDHINDLNQVEDNTLVELGLSFDKPYSYTEIQSLLPSQVDSVWWWVDAYTKEYLKYMKQVKLTFSADGMLMYGFHSEQFEITGGIETFMTSVEQLRSSKSFKWEADQIHESLAGDNNTLDQTDVKIIGAVVTGTAKQLKLLQGYPFIKASTFGVISDKKNIPN